MTIPTIMMMTTQDITSTQTEITTTGTTHGGGVVVTGTEPIQGKGNTDLWFRSLCLFWILWAGLLTYETNITTMNYHF